MSECKVVPGRRAATWPEGDATGVYASGVLHGKVPVQYVGWYRKQ